MEKKRYLVATPLLSSYRLADFGVLSGVFIPADIYVRYLKAKGHEVLFLGGSENHSIHNLRSAGVQKRDFQLFIEDWYNQLGKLLGQYDVNLDYFGHNSTSRHEMMVLSFYEKLVARGAIKPMSMAWPFCQDCQTVLVDGLLVGTCPVCGHQRAYADNCLMCGAMLGPEKLKRPQCLNCHSWNIVFSEEQDNMGLMAPSKDDFLARLSFLKGGPQNSLFEWIEKEYDLKNWPVLRPHGSGVQLPLKLEGGPNWLYSGLDSLLSYLSITKEYFDSQGFSSDQIEQEYLRWWKDDQTCRMLFMRKEDWRLYAGWFEVLAKESGEFCSWDAIYAYHFRESKLWFLEVSEALKFCLSDHMRACLILMQVDSPDSSVSWGDCQNRINNQLVGSWLISMEAFLGLIQMKKIESFCIDQKSIECWEDLYGKQFRQTFSVMIKSIEDQEHRQFALNLFDLYSYNVLVKEESYLQVDYIRHLILWAMSSLLMPKLGQRLCEILRPHDHFLEVLFQQGIDGVLSLLEGQNCQMNDSLSVKDLMTAYKL